MAARALTHSQQYSKVTGYCEHLKRAGATRKGDTYDCFHLGPWELNRTISDSGLVADTMVREAIRILANLEERKGFYRLASLLPQSLIDGFSCCIPTMVLVIRKA